MNLLCRIAGCFLLAVQAAPAADPSSRLELSRHLYSEYSCAACHQQPVPPFLLPPNRGPVLDGVQGRLKVDWIREFLGNPQSVKPGATMPNMVAHLPEGERAEVVEDLTHFLLSGKTASFPSHRHANPVGGEQLYNSIGCAVCHSEGDDLSAKYTFPSLTAFLVDPLVTRPDGRMPSLGLNRDEAADIASFLLRMKPGYPEVEKSSFRPDSKRVARGKQSFEQLNCAACHTRSDAAKPVLSNRGLAEVLKYPAAPDCAGPPVYKFSDSQRAAMAGEKTFQPLDMKGSLAATMRRLNCYACHSRDGVGGPNEATRNFFTGDETLGNEGKFPPSLTGVGGKLTKEWMAKILDGKGTLRPYLNVRMPVFGKANVQALPHWFAKADGQNVERPAIVGDLESGRQLMGTNGGMGCITCHGWSTNDGVAMPGLNLSGTAERLHFSWFRQHLINPQETHPGTLMPSFWPGGKSGNPKVLQGDTERQIRSLWVFLEKGQAIPEGFPDPGSGKFEIIPKDRPVVQRGFMEPGGTSAIAVGFPAGIHYIYSPDICAPVVAWEGKFLDGYKLWFSRRDPTGKPLADKLHDLPNKGKNILQMLSIENKNRSAFQGYRLHTETGVPTFLFGDERRRVEDTLIPAPGGKGLQRTVQVFPASGGDAETKTYTFEYQW